MLGYDLFVTDQIPRKKTYQMGQTGQKLLDVYFDAYNQLNIFIEKTNIGIYDLCNHI